MQKFLLPKIKSLESSPLRLIKRKLSRAVITSPTISRGTFSLPASSMSISSNFVPTQGFHPVLHISVTPSPAPAPSCRLFSLISVPPSFIIDRYQLSQLHIEGKLGIQDGILEVLGEGDLEGPTWKAQEAAALIQLSNNASTGTRETKLEVPLHMRYQQPAKRRRKTEKGLEEDRVEVKLNQPRVFWACTGRE